MKSAEIRVSNYTVVCPHCWSYLEGFMGDVRGEKNLECEDCKESFMVPKNPRIIFH